MTLIAFAVARVAAPQILNGDTSALHRDEIGSALTPSWTTVLLTDIRRQQLSSCPNGRALPDGCAPTEVYDACLSN
jgi:hypothetical protein